MTLNDTNVDSSLLIEEVKLLNSQLYNLLYKRVPLVLSNRAVEKSADYAENNMPGATIFSGSHKPSMWQCAVSKIKIDGHIAEFGVFQGVSINFLAKLIYPKKIFGFDSFRGLEEDYVLDHYKGSFDQNGVIPNVDENVCLVKGSFSESLPKWLNNNKGVFSLINIDCDTYESTLTVLNEIGPSRIVPGTLILFDEYFGFHGWENCEFKAWQEYCKKNNINYKYIAVCQMQVLIEVL
jgi:hypothetical protein